MFVRLWLGVHQSGLYLQDGKAVVAVLFNLGGPARLSVGRWAAPRVVVEGVEITALVIGTAVHVGGHLVSVAVDIGGRVADGNGSVASAISVLLEITSDGLDIWGTVGGVVIVDDLITTEEEERVGVVGKSIDSGEDALQINSVVRNCWVCSVKRVFRSVDIFSTC